MPVNKTNNAAISWDASVDDILRDVKLQKYPASKIGFLYSIPMIVVMILFIPFEVLFSQWMKIKRSYNIDFAKSWSVPEYTQKVIKMYLEQAMIPVSILIEIAMAPCIHSFYIWIFAGTSAYAVAASSLIASISAFPDLMILSLDPRKRVDKRLDYYSVVLSFSAFSFILIVYEALSVMKYPYDDVPWFILFAVMIELILIMFKMFCLYSYHDVLSKARPPYYHTRYGYECYKNIINLVRYGIFILAFINSTNSFKHIPFYMSKTVI